METQTAKPNNAPAPTPAKRGRKPRDPNAPAKPKADVESELKEAESRGGVYATIAKAYREKVQDYDAAKSSLSGLKNEARKMLRCLRLTMAD